MNNNNKKFLFGYEWDNGYDNCLTEEKYYSFGSYIDLCGMSPKDALAAMNSQCNCNGGGGSSSSGGKDDVDSKIENVLEITLEPSQINNILYITLEEAA